MNQQPGRAWVRVAKDVVVLAALGALGALVPVPAQAQEQGHRGPGRRPPPEAFAACEGRSDGDACTVDFHGDQLAGTCTQVPQQQLFCRPARMPAPPSGQAPVEGPPPSEGGRP